MPVASSPACPFLLVLKQPDLGSALVFVGILFAMLFWAGVRPRLLFLLASPGGRACCSASAHWAWSAWMVAAVRAPGLLAARISSTRVVGVPGERRRWGPSRSRSGAGSQPYQQNRLLTFLNPEVDPQKAGYHAIQSKVAIGSGGWFGTGYTEGPQKRLAFLPEQHTDFVFSVVGEELGFVGVLVGAGPVPGAVPRRCSGSPGGRPTPSRSLVVFGILGLLFTHVFENVGMTVNLMPITGIPLPFFSYGGSFFLICCALHRDWPAGSRGSRGCLAISDV